MVALTPGLTRLKTLLESDQAITPSKVVKYIDQAAIVDEDLVPYADYHHPLEDGYGRKLVYTGKYFEIMVMSWRPDDISAVHDHGHTSWGAVQVFGHVMHQNFAIKNGVFTMIRKEILPAGSIIKVNGKLIHQMGNVTSKRYQTLHVYGDYDFQGDVTQDSRIFDVLRGLVKHTNGGAFYNLADKDVFDISPMPSVDEATFVGQAAILLQYNYKFPNKNLGSLCSSVMQKLNVDKKI